MTPTGAAPVDRWPSLPVADWEATRDTLQLWTQVVGKVRMATTPTVNHWWNVPLYVTARGLTTSLMPHPSGTGFEIDFDLQAHRLDIVTVAGERRSFPLASRPVSAFYDELMTGLDAVGVATPIWPMPVEIEGAIPFVDDHVHATYHPDHAQEPAGFRDATVAPDDASYREDLGEFVLPYEVVRTAADPDHVLLDFLQSTYEAAATTASWDRQALEGHPPIAP
jgi:hypothetical protein